MAKAKRIAAYPVTLELSGQEAYILENFLIEKHDEKALSSDLLEILEQLQDPEYV